MIQFTCSECDSDEWTVHGHAVVGSRPRVEEIRCVECGNSEGVPP